MAEAVALLAPVPHMHLDSGLDVCRTKGSVIFGSDRWGLFEDRGVAPGAPVYIYASLLHAKGQPLVTWQAEYVRYIRHEEMHGAETQRRPPTTEAETEGTFVGYWEVRNLRRLEPDEAFPITDLTPEDSAHFSQVFVPHGPVAVAG